MGNRLTRIYTRTGDGGTTGLGDGSRVRKESVRVEAYGTVDELNSAIGVAMTTAGVPADVVACLEPIQHQLFDLGGELSVPGRVVLTDEQVTALERHLDRFNDALPPLKDFILPGGNAGAAACHLARAICRRAERCCWALARSETVNAASLRYLNRLSDLLFVLARVAARSAGGSEVLWKAAQPGSA
ncbi:MAG: cob(I)yrinic acid a,c-diamide adenosyltransferase [Gammaproteobacteria bacterium]|nr:cob(I)yrinic acid a,c-diamide adenosyltransferase [Gammaproteobacteria bacterium]